MNVIDCPNCKKAIGESEAAFSKSDKGLHRFIVKCLLCDHEWDAHHAHFYRKFTDGPVVRNPFQPLRII